MPTVQFRRRDRSRVGVRARDRVRVPVRLRVLAGIVLATGVAACSAGVPSVSTDISTRQAMLDLGQNLVDVREENAALQAQVDSLRGAVAYQDTVLRQLAGLAGVQMRPPALVVP